MANEVLAFPLKSGTEKKRYRRVRCPDEYLELPPPPKLYEADPVMLADIEETGQRCIQSVEKYRDRMPPFWFDLLTTWVSGSYLTSAIKVGNESLLKDAEAQEMKIRMGLKLVKH